MVKLLLPICLAVIGLLSAQDAPQTDETAHEFTADISKMMKIIINSLYSNKDVFLRELISNCADAMSKVRVQARENPAILGEGDNARLDIRIIPDREDQTIAVIDRGIGMNETELIENLGSIAHSGTQRFLDGVGQNQSAVDLIGQFGVGFYSAFLVADKVVVTSKRYADKQYIWTSNNAQSFDVVEDKTGPSLFRGTKVLLHLRDDTYANATLIKELALHYSEFVDFPIYVRMESGQAGNPTNIEDDDDNKATGEDEYRLDPIPSVSEKGHRYDFVHINTKKAIWLRDPSAVNASDYVDFYRSITRDYNETPLTWTHYNDKDQNGSLFRSILFIPQEVPDMEMTANRKYQSLKLYVHRVLITEEFDDFIPRYLSWIRGVVDSEDLQLNVSREMLQESKKLRAIGRKIVKRILQLLLDMAKKNEEDGDPLYEQFYAKYNRFIKLGIMEESPGNRKKLARLLRFNSTRSPEKAISLDDYLEHMKKDQTDFFYIAGDPRGQNLTQSPFLIPYQKRGIEVMFFTEPIDEAMIRDLKEYNKKIFICITQADRNQVDTASEFEKEKLKQWKKRFKPLVTFFQEALGKKIVRAEVSVRLAADSRTPCVLSHTQAVSASMERHSRVQHRSDPRFGIKQSKKVLEINPTNNLIKRMEVAVEMIEAEQLEGPDADEDPELSEERLKNAKLRLETIALLLYDTAVFESGYVLTDMNEYSERVFDVLTRMTGLPDAPVIDDRDIVREVLKEEEELEMKLAQEEEEFKKKEAERKKKEAERRKKRDEEELLESEAEKKENEEAEKKKQKNIENDDDEEEEEEETEKSKDTKTSKKKGKKSN